jgi:peroxiredoxin (alkyl hydroperoxide reductase subunit C)
MSGPYPLPKIGDYAPDFTAQTTQGEITLSTWQERKWVVLFSLPADFTSKELTEFEQRGVKLIGISVDSPLASLPYPLIIDATGAVSERYGMIHPGVRALLVIDPKRVVRAVIYYPLDVDRSVDKVVRIIDALKTADKNNVVCPVNGKPAEQELADRLTSETGAAT